MFAIAKQIIVKVSLGDRRNKPGKWLQKVLQWGRIDQWHIIKSSVSHDSQLVQIYSL